MITGITLGISENWPLPVVLLPKPFQDVVRLCCANEAENRRGLVDPYLSTSIAPSIRMVQEETEVPNDVLGFSLYL